VICFLGLHSNYCPFDHARIRAVFCYRACGRSILGPIFCAARGRVVEAATPASAAIGETATSLEHRRRLLRPLRGEGACYITNSLYPAAVRSREAADRCIDHGDSYGDTLFHCSFIYVPVMCLILLIYVDREDFDFFFHIWICCRGMEHVAFEAG
jgi:hypothetical protein